MAEQNLSTQSAYVRPRPALINNALYAAAGGAMGYKVLGRYGAVVGAYIGWQVFKSYQDYKDIPTVETLQEYTKKIKAEATSDSSHIQTGLDLRDRHNVDY